MAVRLVIAGCCGRMGQAIAHAALQDRGVAIAGAFEASGHQAVGQEYAAVLGQPLANGLIISADPRHAMGQGDVVIEFTLPEPTVAHVTIARELRKPMVIGTTGLTDGQVAALKAAAQTIPILFSPNMSLGVNVLFELAALAAQRLGSGYQIRVAEAHHQHKKDAPSGTAKRLVEHLARARKQPASSIPVDVTREGDIVGDHTVILESPAERLELFHHARSRDVFAQGAIKAAQFIVNQQPGLYDMSHVLRGTP